MKLKTNSISSKLYRYFYGTIYLPTSFCEYFPKLIIAYIFIIPTSIIFLPTTLLSLYHIITKNFDYNDLDFWQRFLFSFLIYLGLFVVISMLSPIGLFFITYEKETFFGFLSSMGIGLWIILIGVSIIFGIIKLIEYYSKKPSKPNKPSILIEYIKAKKNKYCPKIDWE